LRDHIIVELRLNSTTRARPDPRGPARTLSETRTDPTEFLGDPRAAKKSMRVRVVEFSLSLVPRFGLDDCDLFVRARSRSLVVVTRSKTRRIHFSRQRVCDGARSLCVHRSLVSRRRRRRHLSFSHVASGHVTPRRVTWRVVGDNDRLRAPRVASVHTRLSCVPTMIWIRIRGSWHAARSSHTL